MLWCCGASSPVAAAGWDVVFQLLTSVPLHGFQRSTAAALCDLTTEVLRTINATENAMVEYGLSEPIDRSHLVGTDVKQADDAFRELEENVSLQHELHTSLSLKPNPLPRPKHDGNVWTGFNLPGCCVSVHQRQGWCRSNTLGPVSVQFESSYSSSRFRKRLRDHLKHAPEQLVKPGRCSLLFNSLKAISKNDPLGECVQYKGFVLVSSSGHNVMTELYILWWDQVFSCYLFSDWVSQRTSVFHWCSGLSSSSSPSFSVVWRRVSWPRGLSCYLFRCTSRPVSPMSWSRSCGGSSRVPRISLEGRRTRNCLSLRTWWHWPPPESRVLRARWVNGSGWTWSCLRGV